jgi:hypothetical protein
VESANETIDGAESASTSVSSRHHSRCDAVPAMSIALFRIGVAVRTVGIAVLGLGKRMLPSVASIRRSQSANARLVSPDGSLPVAVR